MDAQVGELLQQLEEDGLADNTIVFYWSDHGDGVPRAKRSLYDSGLRVPLMIRWPKALGSTVAPGSVRDELVSFIDLAPTVLALAGVEHSGASAGTGAGGPVEPRRRRTLVFAARDRMDIEYDMMRSARDARFLYIRNFVAGAALRRPRHLPQPERDHAGVAPAAGGAEADRPGGAVDADAASGRGALRHRRPIRTRSTTSRRSRPTAPRWCACATRSTAG